MRLLALAFVALFPTLGFLGSPAKPQAAIADTEIVISEPDRQERARLRSLAHRLCSKLLFDKANGNRNSGPELDKIIAHHNGWAMSDKSTSQKVSLFLNANNSYLICPQDDTYHQAHWMMRAIEMCFHKYPLMNHYLDEEAGYSIDFNFVVTAGYDRGTIIDYIDSVRLRPDYKIHYAYKEIEELRYILTTFYDAKPASELEQGN